MFVICNMETINFNNNIHTLILKKSTYLEKYIISNQLMNKIYNVNDEHTTYSLFDYLAQYLVQIPLE